MSRAVPVAGVCGSCRKTRLSGYNPGTFCTPCQRALFDRQHLAGPGARDDMAAWVWDTGPMRDALARLDFPAVLVIYRSAAGLSRRELGERTGLSESVILGSRPAAGHLRHPPAPAVRGLAPHAPPGAAAGNPRPAGRPQRPARRSGRHGAGRLRGGGGPWVTIGVPRLRPASVPGPPRPGWPRTATRRGSRPAATRPPSR